MGDPALAEDVVQEALVRAMQSWPYYGAPENPAAWLTQTAKNLALTSFGAMAVVSVVSTEDVVQPESIRPAAIAAMATKLV